ncbi:MAG: hypothetical protein ACKVHE_32010 [Planctomycetales bacterium]|jgi:hypothetical protein
MTHSIFNRMFCQALVLITVLAVGTADAAEFVQVVHGPAAGSIEKLAARELADMLGRVFDDVEVRSGSVVARRPGTKIFVGSPYTNPNIAQNFAEWPKVTDQGIVIRSESEKKMHAVVGGSPAATLWAVYELGHRLGIRYLLRGDIDPLSKRPFDLSDIDVTMEPDVHQRGWETLGVGAHSFESWGLADHQRLIRQFAKMKFNQLILKIEPWHPFLMFKHAGMSKTTGTFQAGRKYPLTGDVVGKKAFGGAKFFSHPIVTDSQTPAKLHVAARRFLKALIKSAHDYGMSVSVQVRRTRFAPEFAAVLSGASRTPGRLLSVSSASTRKPGPNAQGLFTARMTSWFKTYPGVDEVSWRKSALATRRVGTVAFVDRAAAKASNPNLDQEQLVGEAQEQLVGEPQTYIPVPKKNSRLSLAVHSSSLDMLPHTHVHDVERTLRNAIIVGWDSVSVGPSTVNEFSQDVHYVSRAMWDVSVGPAESHKDLWGTTTGNESATERLWLGRQHLEKASTLILENDADLVKLGPGMLIKRHYIAEPIPDWWQEATDAYTQYLIELYRAQGAVDGGAKPVLFYYAKRSEFVLEYLGAVKAVREAALAKKAGDTEQAIEYLELALESTYNCINTLSDVARNQGDRGLIAVLNAYAYRPLVAELERLSDAE